MMLLTRALVGLAVSATAALAAERWRALSRSGVVAAVLVGTSCVVGGTAWIALLAFFFLSSSGFSRWREAEKDARVGGIVVKGGARDWAQVLANGLPVAVAALASLGGHPGWAAFGAGTLAAAAADTWSTEVGTLARAAPRHLLAWRIVPAGTSGGVTALGSAAAVAGAVATSLVAVGLGLPVSAVPIAAGGVAGAFADSVLGCTLQERRWCDRCDAPTERRVHRCGAATRQAGGLAGFGNDAVNLTSIIVGGWIAWVLS